MEFNIFSFLIVAVMCVIGIGSTVCIVGVMIYTLVQKFYRRIVHGIPLTK